MLEFLLTPSFPPLEQTVVAEMRFVTNVNAAFTRRGNIMRFESDKNKLQLGRDYCKRLKAGSTVEQLDQENVAAIANVVNDANSPVTKRYLERYVIISTYAVMFLCPEYNQQLKRP